MSDTPEARLAILEAERRRAFEEAQREADTMFAQYQLSQLLALGRTLEQMAPSVVRELVCSSEAVAGALWLTPPGSTTLRLVAEIDEATGPGSGPGRRVPRRFADPAAAGAWANRAGWYGVALEERRELDESRFERDVVGYLAFLAPEGRELSHDHARFLSLARHELAIALRAAQLRETLADERALLEAILEGASDAIVAVDGERRVVRLNQAAVRLLGHQAARQGERTCRELLGCDRDTAAGVVGLRCGARCPFEEVLAGLPHIVDREQAVDGPAGVVPVAASYSRMSSSEPGAVAVLRDLRGMQALEELRSSFLAAVSHELRTPLALISGYVESLLKLDLDPDAQRHSIERIGHATGRLAKLVDEILDLTQIESDRLALGRERVSLASIVVPVCTEVGEAPDSPRIEVALPDDLPPVDVDPVRIAHVLVNLLDNAQKYAGGSDGRVRVEAARDPRGVVVRVVDDGPGIHPDDRPHVFDRFYRGTREQRRRSRGTGLGLYLCLRLVEAHGGRIWLEERDVGTAVAFTLPVPAGYRERRAPT